jgi:chromosome segregation ATPase
MTATLQEIEQAIQAFEQKIGKIQEKVNEIDEQIKNTSVNSVDKIESELEQLKNAYYEVLARELLGEFDEKQKKEIEENIQAAERKLKGENDRLQNFVGIRHALESEFRKTQTQIEQHQSALERLEFEGLKQEKQNIIEEINSSRKHLEELFGKVSSYNLKSVGLVAQILDREYKQRGLPQGPRPNGDNREKVNQLAEPFDINGVKNSFAETLSEIVCKSLSN